MYKKVVFLLVLLLAIAGNVKAQDNDNPVDPKWFVSGGINGVTALNGSATNELNGKISGGLWINKIIGVRININAGNNWLKNGYTAFTAGGGVDLIANLMKRYADENSKFRLSAICGVGLSYYSFSDDFPNNKSIGTFTANFGLQAAWKLNDKLDFFVEPGIRFSPKYFKKENKDEPFTSGTFTLGVIYNF